MVPAELIELAPDESKAIDLDCLAVDEALALLEAQSERAARIVEMRLFAGYHLGEISDSLGVSSVNNQARLGIRAWILACQAGK